MVRRKSKKATGSNSRFLLILMAVLAVAVFFITLTLFQKFFQTETYYVLNQDVPTRTQVMPEMLEPVVAAEGTSPQSAIGLEEVQTGSVYTKYPLRTGDILTMSNVGGIQDISVGIPDEWVVTNFEVSADDAVGGRIRRGTYFDILVATQDKSFYPFVNVLALDTTVSLSSATSADAAETEEAHAGQTSQYVVGMSPENAAKLHNIVQKYGQNIKLVLSPRANEYRKPALSDYRGAFSFQDGDEPVWPGESANGEITDNTFTDLERDRLGKPTGRRESCSQGNARISGEACKNINSDAKPSTEPSMEPSTTPTPEATNSSEGR